MKLTLTKATLSAAIAAASLSAAQLYAADYTFSFAHVLIEETPNGQAALRFKEEVEEKSDGRIEINVLPAAQVGATLKSLSRFKWVLSILVSRQRPRWATLSRACRFWICRS
ncbi:hypothetical protein HSBAA_60220 [Vreelandella sulfidaeris]|uniref:Uncharacterized protein n=1 Tax=Vreelandella sulfidaeris TaxID=115553 RepID=A0A455UEJ8_9GAMM|nr:hypothetical protein HSBAA_60220 [Halomonas sulfidaeris]